MLVLLLVLLDRATARAPLHEHLIGKRNEEFGTRHEEFGEDYGYVEADWNHENKASKHGVDYGTDYGYVDAKHGADYAKEYEYKTSSEGFRSGTVDPEICLCGKQDVENSAHAGRIVGGKESAPNNHPWQVSLEVTKEKKHHCGASLISKRHVLTAAHCMDDVDLKDIPGLLTVVLGIHDLSKNEKAQRVEIAKVHLPPNFSWETLKKDGINDAALLELKKDVEMSSKVLPICLPSGEESLVGKKLVISGWGKVKQEKGLKMRLRRSIKTQSIKDSAQTGHKHRLLQEAQVKLISADECQKNLKGVIPKVLPSHVCGFTPGVDACQGDSGGPASVVKEGRHTQIGIVSLGKGCGDPRYPGLYTRVSSMMKWIKETTAGYTIWDSKCQKIKN